MPDPTFVLVPGAGGDPVYWGLVQDRLTAQGVASVAVPLPGSDPTQGLPEYVDRVVRAASPHDDVVLVGQSLGGFSSAWAATVVVPRELVLVNAMVPAPGETAGQWWAATGHAEAMAASDRALGRDPALGLDVAFHFLHDVPAGALAADEDEDHREGDAVFAAPWAPTSWPDVPTRVVAGADDRLFPLPFQQRVARERLDLDVEVVPGGHLVALSRPDELTAALLRTHT